MRLNSTFTMSKLGSLGLFAAAVALLPTADSARSAAPETPQTIQLTGIVRDFIERSKPGGHSDFEQVPNLGFGHYCANIAPELGPDGKPVFTGLGWKVDRQWKDAQGRPICYTLYNAALGDVPGRRGSNSKGGITSAETFNKWFNDELGVNLSAPLTLTFVREADGSYTFDDKFDPQYSSMGGFFPIDNQLFGNSGGAPDHNFHFTFELHTTFVYRAGTGQVFKFIGDDDVWVFINGKLVIDIGGVHEAVEQFVDLDRLGLVDGKTYPLAFFFAERHRTQSNFRIQTNIELVTQGPYTINAPYD